MTQSKVLRWAGAAFSTLSAMSAFADLPACTLSSGAITDTSPCWTQPENYGITIYKVGLCTSAPGTPTSSVAADLSSCSTVFENTSGSDIILTSAGSTALSGAYTRPPTGTYTHGYVVIGNTFEVNTEFLFNRTMAVYTGGPTHNNSGARCWTREGTSYTWGNGIAVDCGATVSNKGTVSHIMNSFSGVEDYDTTSTFSVGGTNYTMSGYLVQSDLKLGTGVTSANAAGTVTRLLGVTTLSTTVTGAETGMNIAFKNSLGATVFVGTGGNDKMNFIGGGPFEVVLTMTQ